MYFYTIIYTCIYLYIEPLYWLGLQTPKGNAWGAHTAQAVRKLLDCSAGMPKKSLALVSFDGAVLVMGEMH